MFARPATLADAASIAEIGRVAFPPTYAGSLDSAVIETVLTTLYTDVAAAAAVQAAEQEPGTRFLVASSPVPGCNQQVAGFLHYDELGPEPELHRLYLRPQAIGRGVGSLLMRALHDTLPPNQGYVLLVAASNARAITFYRRHGLTVRESVDAVEYYRRNMGVAIDAGAAPYPAYLMQRLGGSPLSPAAPAQ